MRPGLQKILRDISTTGIFLRKKRSKLDLPIYMMLTKELEMI